MTLPVRRDVEPNDLPGVVAALTRDANLAGFELAAIANAAGVTITAAQLLAGYIERSGAAGVSDTTPTAAQLNAAIPNAEVNDCRLVIIRNANTGTLTLVGGTNVTIVGTATIATVTTGVYVLRKSSATAYTLTRILALAY